MAYRTLAAPFSIQVETCWHCDNNCRWCYNFYRHKDMKLVAMSLPQAELVAEEAIKCQLLRVVPTGGEPLLVPEVTLALIRKARAAGIGVSLNTNMNNFSKGIGQELLKLGVTTIVTSITADNAEMHDWLVQHKGSFSKLKKNLKLATSMGFRIIGNMVLTKWNIDRMEQTGNMVGTLGLAKFAATRACPPGPIAQDFESNLISVSELRQSLATLLQLKEKWGYGIDIMEHYPWCAIEDIQKYRYLARRQCTAGITSASVGANGQLRPCGHAFQEYGSVFEKGLQTPWLKMDDWREQKYAAQKCRDCKHFVNDDCTGGCPVDNLCSAHGVDTHVTCESDVKYTPPEMTEEMPIIEKEELFYIPSDVLIRPEEFGGLMATERHGYILINGDTYALILSLKQEGQFSIQTLMSRAVSLNDSNALLNHLLFKQLIKRTSERR